jgi:hypothetical protein
MNRIIPCVLLTAATLVANGAQANLTLYELESFAGRPFTVEQVTSNFDGTGFNDRAQSAVVTGRSWEICTDANFGGGCTVLPPGRYPALGGMGGRVSSARPVAGGPAAAPPVGGPPPGGPIGSVTFYETGDFSGRQFRIDQLVPNFAGRFNDRAQSAIVDGGPWEICADADFHGQCRIFVPGRYPNIAGLAGRVSSARPAYAAPQGGPPPYGAPQGGPPPGRPNRFASATLFSGPNFTGQAFPLAMEGSNNLDGMFNDRASSLRVERGYWIFCSDADFRGECRTFGPGEYPRLPPELRDRVSSGRRISNEYPYNAPPVWR